MAKYFPKGLKNSIKTKTRRALPSMSPADLRIHFTPSYNPWDQRLCLCPDGDFFEALNSDKATIITDHIETFTGDGIELKSGKKLEGDLVVTATGFNLQENFPMSDAVVDIDGKQFISSNHMSYKGTHTDHPHTSF